MTIEKITYQNRTNKFVVGAAVLLCLTGLFTVRGCQAEAKNFVPPSEDAQGAIKQAMEAWQSGAMSGEVAGTKPQVYVVDMSRKPSRRLERFEILGETPARAGRMFAVQLHLTKPMESVKAEFVVVGIDPLWVFRRKDYELFLHWDHLPTASETDEPAK